MPTGNRRCQRSREQQGASAPDRSQHIALHRPALLPAKQHVALLKKPRFANPLINPPHQVALVNLGVTLEVVGDGLLGDVLEGHAVLRQSVDIWLEVA